mgnify:CR=1 FL=1
MRGRLITDALTSRDRCKKNIKRKVFQVFVDLVKAFERNKWELIRWVLKRQIVPEHLLRLVIILLLEIISKVKTVFGTSEEFTIKVGVHEASELSPFLFITVMERATCNCTGSMLSPLLFITVMEKSTCNCRGGGLEALLYLDDLVLIP